MDRNSILAILLVFLIWTSWMSFQAPPQKQGESPSHVAEKSEKNENPQLNSNENLPLENPKIETSKRIAKKFSPESERILENEFLKVVIGSTGGQIKSLLLKKYRESLNKKSPPINLISNEGDEEPFGLRLNSLGEDLIVLGFREKGFDPEKKEVVYEFLDRDFLGKHSVKIEKTYRLEPHSYNLHSQIRIINIGNRILREQPGITWNKWLGEPPRRKMFSPPPDLWQSMALLAGNKLVKMDAKDSESVSGSISWASLGSRYFLMAIFPLWEGGSKFVSQEKSLKSGKELENTLWASQLKLAPGESVKLTYKIFAGPKELALLEGEGSHLNRALDLGFFEFFALLLLKILKFSYSLVGNWGLAIIFLTVLIKIVLFPLSHKSFKSMKEMQKIQPLLKELREKFKDDKEQLNMQTLKVMKEHKVNPLGGCLPMLIQLPIWFALYKVLYSSIELRHAPFYFWIQDLSAKDPYYITPILLGVSMFVQQRFSPKPPDPMQAKMMMFMPLMFSFIMLGLPSGLVIYIFCNTFLSILQQAYINRSLDGKPLLSFAGLKGQNLSINQNQNKS